MTNGGKFAEPIQANRQQVPYALCPVKVLDNVYETDCQIKHFCKVWMYSILLSELKAKLTIP